MDGVVPGVDWRNPLRGSKGRLEEVDHVCVCLCGLKMVRIGDRSLQLYKLVVHKLTQEEL